jgi:predicted MFS family arabinose efflux permease
MGLVGAAFGLGFVFGPAIGGLLSRWGPTVPMWSASALCAANVVAALMFLPESRVMTSETRHLGRLEAMTHPKVTLLLGLYFLVPLAFSAFEATFALFSERRFGFTGSTIGFVFTFIGTILAIVQGVVVGRVVKRVGEAQLIPAAIALIAISIGLVPFSFSISTLLFAVGLLALGMGFNSPAMSSMISRLSHADDQGGIMGLASSLASLGRVGGPAFGGFLFDHFGMTVPYLSAAAMMLVAFAVSFVGLRGSDLLTNHAGES